MTVQLEYISPSLNKGLTVKLLVHVQAMLAHWRSTKMVAYGINNLMKFLGR